MQRRLEILEAADPADVGTAVMEVLGKLPADLPITPVDLVSALMSQLELEVRQNQSSLEDLEAAILAVIQQDPSRKWDIDSLVTYVGATGSRPDIRQAVIGLQESGRIDLV